ncbi:MAG: dual specificity protein phosphatase family protein [Phycisphaerae bacterium]|nr:dual specificity protein phosphatase family protein [Phycisphaerae bacterium]
MKLLRRAFLLAAPLTLTLGCGRFHGLDLGLLTPLDNFHTVEAGKLYRSAQLGKHTLKAVCQKMGIRTVVNLRGQNSGSSWYDDESACCAAIGVKLVNIPMESDEMPTREAMLELWDTFENGEYPMLVHCKAGADRTGGAVAIWRMMEGESRQAAARELSAAYGHSQVMYPEWDWLLGMFRPSREWIEHEYPVQ